MDSERRAALLAAMQKDAAGSRALDAFLNAWYASNMARQATRPEARISASTETLRHALAAAEAVGAIDELRRRMVSAAHRQPPDEGTDIRIDRIFSKKKTTTAAGRGDMRMAAARLLLDVGLVVSARVGDVMTGHVVAANAGHDGPMGSGDEAGFLFQTEITPGVNRKGGPEFFGRRLIMKQAGYHMGALGIELPADKIPMTQWAAVALWVRRNRKQFGRIWDAATIRGWAIKPNPDADIPLKEVFEQNRQKGLADRRQNRVDRRKCCFD
jgi:hypothetical protein